MFGSCSSPTGAALGPLLTGLITSKYSWGNVFYMLIAADVMAALVGYK